MAEATAGALQIVQTQQNLVGRTVVGGASAVTGESPDSKAQVGILEQIREITLKSFRATTNIAKTLTDSFNFEKNKAARERDQAAELSKESGIARRDEGETGIDKIQKDTEDKGKRSILFFGGLSKLFDTLMKPFKSLMGFIMKIGPVAKVFNALGPAASGLLRLTGIGTVIFLLIKYSDEIIKALTPAIEAVASAYEKLKPGIDFVISIIDGGIKIAINAIGGALSGIGSVLNLMADSFSGVYNIITGLFTGDWEKAKKGLKDLVMAPINFLKSIGNIVFDFIAGIIDSLPLPKFIKDKFKGAVEKKETGTGSAGDMSAEASSTTGEVMDEGQKQVTPIETPQTTETPQLQTIEPEPAAPTVVEEKPKTMNMDKTTSAVEVAQKIEGDPNLPPLGLNMYKLKGETYEERATQYQAFKEALIKAHKDGIISEEETKFRAMRLKDEKDSLARVKRIIDIRKQKAELTGQPFDESALLSESDTDRAAIQKQTLAEEGMTETSFNEALTNKLKPNVNRRDLASQTQTAGITVVNNQPTTVSSQNSVARSEVMVSRPSASTGDPYLDKQNYAVT